MKTVRLMKTTGDGGSALMLGISLMIRKAETGSDWNYPLHPAEHLFTEPLPSSSPLSPRVGVYFPVCNSLCHFCPFWECCPVFLWLSGLCRDWQTLEKRRQKGYRPVWQSAPTIKRRRRFAQERGPVVRKEKSCGEHSWMCFTHNSTKVYVSEQIFEQPSETLTWFHLVCLYRRLCGSQPNGWELEN